jgi:hypothetical protein
VADYPGSEQTHPDGFYFSASGYETDFSNQVGAVYNLGSTVEAQDTIREEPLLPRREP